MKPLRHLLPLFLFWTACSSSPTAEQATAPPAEQPTVEAKDTMIEDFPPEPATLEYTPAALADSISWLAVDTGLALAEIPAPIQCNVGDSRITVLRIDPAYYEFELVSAGNHGGYARTAPEWAAEKNLIAAFNAGMFQTDGVTNAGLMKSGSYVNNARFNPKYKSIAAFNPQSPDLPPFTIIDVECDDWKSLCSQYQSYTQCLRMVSCQQTNVWSQQQRYWSMVSIGVDKEGRVLFCFTRSPYSVHDFIDMLLRLPLGLSRMMYLEGGPETSFYLNHRGVKVEKTGSYETNFYQSNSSREFWAIPNVIGVRKK